MKVVSKMYYNFSNLSNRKYLVRYPNLINFVYREFGSHLQADRKYASTPASDTISVLSATASTPAKSDKAWKRLIILKLNLFIPCKSNRLLSSAGTLQKLRLFRCYFRRFSPMNINWRNAHFLLYSYLIRFSSIRPSFIIGKFIDSTYTYQHFERRTQKQVHKYNIICRYSFCFNFIIAYLPNIFQNKTLRFATLYHIIFIIIP